MPKLYSSRNIEQVLLQLGFFFVSQKGSHAKFRHENGRVTILPMNKSEIPIGTFRSILKQAGISLKEFEKLSQ